MCMMHHLVALCLRASGSRAQATSCMKEAQPTQTHTVHVMPSSLHCTFSHRQHGMVHAQFPQCSPERLHQACGLPMPNQHCPKPKVTPVMQTCKRLPIPMQFAYTAVTAQCAPRTKQTLQHHTVTYFDHVTLCTVCSVHALMCSCCCGCCLC